MKRLQSVLTHLARPEVGELVLATGRPPCLMIGDAVETLPEAALNSDAIVALLFATGGSRYVDDLGAKPTQWKARVDGVGPVMVTATQQGAAVEARIVPLQRDASRTSSKRPARRSAPPRQRISQRPARAGSAPDPGELRLAPPPAIEAFSIRATEPAPPTPSPAAMRRAASAGIAAARVPGPHAATLTRLLASARQAEASDLHVVAGRAPLLRVGGELAPSGEPLAADLVASMLIDVVPPRLSQTFESQGSCDFALEIPSAGRLRVNVSRQRTGLKGTFRLIATQVPSLKSLGLPDAIALATRHHQGLILITGPTGHGKTSTLAAIVDILNRETTHHVITVEDPVEYLHPSRKAMISQREVGTHTRSFQSALKASLREDPDVIVVGELRDAETVRMALSASETGHLVLGTMNTPNAAKTIDRLIDLFPPADQQQVRVTLAGGLRLIVSQRLLPAKQGPRRVAAVELLPGSIALWNLIRDGKTYQIPSLQQRGKGLGIIRQIDSLADLVRAGKTSPAAALAAAEAPDELRTMLQEVPAMKAAARVPEASARGLLDKAGALFKKGT